MDWQTPELKKKMDDAFKDEDPAKVRAAAMSMHKIKECYLRMDGRCRQMMITNPRRPLSDYCHRCNEMFREVMQ